MSTVYFTYDFLNLFPKNKIENKNNMNNNKNNDDNNSNSNNKY